MIIILILNFLVWELLHTDLQSWVQMIWITMSQIKKWYKINVEQPSCNNYFDLLFSILYFDLLAKNELRANAQKNRANRGHSSKPNLPSFSVCNKVLMNL